MYFIQNVLMHKCNGLLKKTKRCKYSTAQLLLAKFWLVRFCFELVCLIYTLRVFYGFMVCTYADLRTVTKQQKKKER